MAILWYSQDHLQLPPVPETSSMLAPLEGKSDEHKVGAKISSNAELVFQLSTAMQSGTGYFLPAKDTRAVREEPPQPPRPVSKAEQGSSFSLFSRPEHPLFTSDEDTDEDGERL